MIELFSGDNFWILILFAAWSLPWKGIALWRAAQKADKWWFIVLLISNTLAVLDILYIFIFNKRKSLDFRKEPVFSEDKKEEKKPSVLPSVQ